MQLLIASARPVLILLVMSLLRPAHAHAAPIYPLALAEDPKAFEAGFIDGQAALDRGEPGEAARIWLRAAEHLPERSANRDNRAAIYEYIADALQQHLRGVDDLAALTTAADALQRYCDDFTRAYGTESPPSAKITAALIDLRRRLDAIELREPQPTPELDREPAPEPAPAPARPARAGRELRIAGGVAVGVGVGAGVLAAAMAARGQRLEREFDDPQANCRLDELVGECAQIYERGQRADMLAITGLSAGALFLSGGLALLLLGRRQAAAARSAFTPLVAPGLTGIGLRGAF
ncbi:MAG: hypothetical protein IPK80_34365 [Nannocystis sp.]|nr:hypothetical protein [Nannocystis sp.]